MDWLTRSDLAGPSDGGFLMPEKIPVRVARRGFGLLFRAFGWPYRIEYVNTANWMRGELARCEVRGNSGG